VPETPLDSDTYAIWAILDVSVSMDSGEAVDGTQWSGAATFIFVYMAVVAAQAITVTFPFALGYSVTRREYYLGTSLLFLLVSAGYAVVLAVLAAIEDATGGWGLGGHTFTAIYFGDEGGLIRLFVFFSLFLFFFFVFSGHVHRLRALAHVRHDRVLGGARRAASRSGRPGHLHEQLAARRRVVRRERGHRGRGLAPAPDGGGGRHRLPGPAQGDAEELIPGPLRTGNAP
jgi:hypothetical protein